MKVLNPLLLCRLAIALIAFLSYPAVDNSFAQTPQPQGPVANIPIEVDGDNKIFLKARVNNSAPLTFLLDSGAGSGLVFYSKAAQLLGLTVQGKGKGSGGGEGTFETRTGKGISLQLSGVQMNDQKFVVFPPEKTDIGFGKPVDGVIGYSLFSRYVVELDYQTKIVNLYEPGTYQYSGSGESVPIKIMSNVPFARVKIPIAGRKPIEGEFIVDLGASRFAIILNTPLVASSKLLTIQKTMKDLGAEGVGGEVKLFVGRLPQLQLGRFTLTDPVVHFAQDQKGVFASDEFDGVIGGELLRRFKLIFDYSRKRLILEAKEGLSEPFEYNMVGIRLRAESDDFKILKVRRVGENSPAEEAGVREGDVISAINGTPATELTIPEINKMFRQESKEYSLEIIRGVEKIQIKLKSRRLI